MSGNNYLMEILFTQVISLFFFFATKNYYFCLTQLQQGIVNAKHCPLNTTIIYAFARNYTKQLKEVFI